MHWAAPNARAERPDRLLVGVAAHRQDQHEDLGRDERARHDAELLELERLLRAAERHEERRRDEEPRRVGDRVHRRRLEGLAVGDGQRVEQRDDEGQHEPHAPRAGQADEEEAAQRRAHDHGERLGEPGALAVGPDEGRRPQDVAERLAVDAAAERRAPLADLLEEEHGEEEARQADDVDEAAQDGVGPVGLVPLGRRPDGVVPREVELALRRRRPEAALVGRVVLDAVQVEELEEHGADRRVAHDEEHGEPPAGALLRVGVARAERHERDDEDEVEGQERRHEQRVVVRPARAGRRQPGGEVEGHERVDAHEPLERARVVDVLDAREAHEDRERVPDRERARARQEAPDLALRRVPDPHRAPALAREGRRPAAAAERPERRRRGPRDRADERQGDEHGDGVDDPQEDRRPGAAPLAPAQDGLEVVAVVAELAERPAVVLGAERVAARVAAGAALVALACVEINQ